MYCKVCVKRPHSKRPNIGFQDQLSLNAGQKYCRMLHGEHFQYFRPSLRYHLSLRSFLSIFEWPFYAGFTLCERMHIVMTLLYEGDSVILRINTIEQLKAVEKIHQNQQS